MSNQQQQQLEKLMGNIDTIVDDFFYENYNGDVAERDELTSILRAAVCKSFHA